ncbi:MAG: TonB family protein [bacterium]|jgi:protein TonB|nr:TonB family protein [candidate division KSB1 bacterium]MDH7560333.1 TonB family protein [bacterium]
MNPAVRIGHFARADIGRGAIVSVAVHALLCLLLALCAVRLEHYPPDFAEVTFLSGERASGQVGEKVAIQQVPPESVPKGEKVVQPSAAAEEVVSLPKRRMLEQEPPELSARAAEKMPVAQPAPEVPAPAAGATASKEAPPREPEAIGGKPTAPTAVTGDVGQSTPQTAGPAGGGQESFGIEGEAANRQILYKVIPEYPHGLQREAVVKVRFVVLPDGSVGEMVPVLKGDATLESITLQALRQWRFNPLPPGAAQKEVTGIITFRYLLR